jgi:hypothetical protein
VARSPKCLVIDTDIARSAGEALEKRSKCCRELLNEILNTGHRVVSTEAIREEWRKHQSKFTRTWLVSMIARKRVCWIEAPSDEELRAKVAVSTVSESEQKAMLKDVHLVEAACKADKIVFSMDERVRKCFHEAALDIDVLKLIVWVNPSREEETPLAWLRDGAEWQKERMLGYYEEGSIEQ